MKKLLQVSILFVFALVLVTSVFTVAGTGSTMAAVTGCTQVVYNPAQQAGQDIDHTFCFPNKLPPPFTPNVGWRG
jgi:hypothetical protein